MQNLNQSSAAAFASFKLIIIGQALLYSPPNKWRKCTTLVKWLNPLYRPTFIDLRDRALALDNRIE